LLTVPQSAVTYTAFGGADPAPFAMEQTDEIQTDATINCAMERNLSD
jgi:hypothetical protein